MYKGCYRSDYTKPKTKTKTAAVGLRASAARGRDAAARCRALWRRYEYVRRFQAALFHSATQRACVCLGWPAADAAASPRRGLVCFGDGAPPSRRGQRASIPRCVTRSVAAHLPAKAVLAERASSRFHAYVNGAKTLHRPSCVELK